MKYKLVLVIFALSAFAKPSLGSITQCPAILEFFSDSQELAQSMRDTLLGIAFGDSFGVGIEMQDREWMKRNVHFDRFLNMRSGEYAKGFNLGDFSDDTSDSLAVIDTLTSNEEFNGQNLLHNIQLHFEKSKLSRNGIPRAGFGSVKKYFEGRISLAELKRLQSEREYPGNAPPMRAVPLGFLSDQAETNKASAVNAYVTHPHPVAEAASRGIAWASRYMILEKQDPALIIDYVISHIAEVDEKSRVYLHQVNQLGAHLTEADYSTLLGPQPVTITPRHTLYGLASDSMHTLGAALYILKFTRSPLEALKRSILMGGDVDSLAAITVGISGGRFGLQNMPPFFRKNTEGQSDIIKTADDFTRWLLTKK